MEAVTVMKSKQSRRLRRELKREKKGKVDEVYLMMLEGPDMNRY